MNNSSNKIKIDNIVRWILLSVSIVCASSIVLIVAFVLKQGALPFFKDYLTDSNEIYRTDLWLFLSGTSWVKYGYGVLGVVINTLYLTAISSVIALVISVLTALFIARIAGKHLGAIMQSVLELLASIPSIIFGLFGQGFVCPLIRDIAASMGIQTMGGSSGLATIVVLVMMMIPTISMVCLTSMRGIKQDQIDASLALGATPMQTNFKVVLKGAQSGIFAGLILGIGRALGEATAVSMVCGMPSTGPVFNLFDITSTLTSTMLLGMHDTSGVDLDIRFSAGVVLIVIIIATNIVLNKIKRRMERV